MRAFRTFALLGGATAVTALMLACEPANLDGKACPCAAASGYVCCKAENVCLRADQVCVDVGPWPISPASGAPRAMDDVTVFAFSQVDTNGAAEGSIDDAQLFDLKPDMVIRAWAQWDKYGESPSDYQFSYVQRLHDEEVRYFMGGATATVLLANQIGMNAAEVAADPKSLTARNAENKMLFRIDSDGNKIYRGTLANPAFRQSLIAIGQIQIDGGVDGLHFEEVNGGYQGARPTGAGDQFIADGNEGFDKFHLADFNAFLLAKNKPGGNFAALYGMTGDNMLRSDVAAGDLNRNFNYWNYLARNGWSATPLTEANPLAKEWGRTTVNRPLPGTGTFVDSAEPYRYWKQIVQALRDYARSFHNREIFITAEGIYPFVDFQSVGLDNYNTDAPDGSPVHYLPLTADGLHLDGAKSLQEPFRHLKALSTQFAPGVPVVLFLDGRWPVYDKFPKSDREDFWRLYSAEAYANGLFFAFHLKSSVGKLMEPPTAWALGLKPLFMALAGFYRAHADYYHGVTASAGQAMASLPSAMIAVNDQLSPEDGTTLMRRLVHLVNHDYQPGVGILHRENVTVTVDSPTEPKKVSLASPDLPGDIPDLFSTYANGQVTLTVPSLDAYAVVVLTY